MEITLALASQGCSVLGTYLTTPPTRLAEVLAPVTGFAAVQVDLATAAPPTPSEEEEEEGEGIPRILTALREQFPGRVVDILVNNASIAELGPLRELTAQRLTAVMTANAVFPAMLLRALLPYLSRSGSARIVNISSEGSHLGRPSTTAYSASKAALESMTRTWAAELGREYNGLTVNALALGLVDTHLWKALPEARREYWTAKVREGTPVAPRIGHTADVAGVVTFVVSDQAAWVSGQVLAVGGGNLMIV